MRVKVFGHLRGQIWTRIFKKYIPKLVCFLPEPEPWTRKVMVYQQDEKRQTISYLYYEEGGGTWIWAWLAGRAEGWASLLWADRRRGPGPEPGCPWSVAGGGWRAGRALLVPSRRTWFSYRGIWFYHCDGWGASSASSYDNWCYEISVYFV